MRLRRPLGPDGQAGATGRAPSAAHIRNPRRRGWRTSGETRATPLRVDWFDAVQVNLSAAERRAATLATRRTVKKEYQAAWLVKAITCIDLTTLAGDDTPGRVRRLCAKARQPAARRPASRRSASAMRRPLGAVCVYHEMIAPAVEALRRPGIPVAAVVDRLSRPACRRLPPAAARDRARRWPRARSEIDIVITRHHVLTGNWQALYDEIAAHAARPAARRT